MGRQVASWADKRGNCYYVRLGELDPKTGKLRPVMLLDERGAKVRLGDEEGRIKSLGRMLAARDEAARRKEGPTVGDLVLAFLKWHEDNGSKPKTIETHRWHLLKFAEFEWGGQPYDFRPASAITLADLTRYRKSMEARGSQTGYVRLAYASVLACWRWATRAVEERDPERILTENPFTDLKRPKKGKGRKLVLPWPVIERLVKFADERNAGVYPGKRGLDRLKCLALRIVAESGPRPHEVAELRWEWVFEAERVLVIPAEHTKTKKDDRIVGISPETAALLVELRASGKSHGTWVFSTANDPRDTAPSAHKLAEWFRALRKDAFAAGIPIPDEASLYTLRHSFVSQVRAGGMDVRELAPGMGHSADVAESTYAHSQRSDIRDLMDRARRARALDRGGKAQDVTPPSQDAP